MEIDVFAAGEDINFRNEWFFNLNDLKTLANHVIAASIQLVQCYQAHLIVFDRATNAILSIYSNPI